MKEKSSSFRLLLALALLLTVTGCYYDEGIDQSISDETIISYSADIQPIFNSNCTSCHPFVIASPDLTASNSYQILTTSNYIVSQNIDSSILYQRLIGNPSIMPPSGSLPQKDIELVKQWIEQGAPNN